MYHQNYSNKFSVCFIYAAEVTKILSLSCHQNNASNEVEIFKLIKPAGIWRGNATKEIPYSTTKNKTNKKMLYTALLYSTKMLRNGNICLRT